MAVTSITHSSSAVSGDELRAPAGSAILARYTIPEPPRNFYPKLVQEVLPTCGFEYRTTDFHSAVQLLNERLALRLDQVEVKVLGLLLTGLSQAHRFSGMLFIDPIRGENSAVHSIVTAIFANEIFRRAGLLTAERQNAEVAGMRVEVTLCDLVHDMGEMFGELNSLEARSRNKRLKENPKLERKIFETCLKLAYKAALDNRPSDFYGALREMREIAGIGRSEGVNGGSKALNRALDTYSKVSLPHSAAVSASVFLRCFELAELHKARKASSTDLFRGYAAKALEHIQGNRHLVRHSVRRRGDPRLKLFHSGSAGTARGSRGKNVPSTPGSEDLLPLSYRESFTVRKALEYTEGELGFLFKHAKSGAEKSLAKAVRDAAYTTLVEGIYAGPPVVDLRKRKTSSTVDNELKGIWSSEVPTDKRKSRLKNVKELLTQIRSNLIEKVRDDRRESGRPLLRSPDTLRRFETRGRLMDLYLYAIERDYQPKPKEVLGLCRELPAPLRNFPRFDWRREALKKGVPPRAKVHGSHRDKKP